MASNRKSTKLFDPGFVEEFGENPTDLNLTQVVVFSLVVHMYLIYLHQNKKSISNEMLKNLFGIFISIATSLMTSAEFRCNFGKLGIWSSHSGESGDLFYYFSLLYFEMNTILSKRIGNKKYEKNPYTLSPDLIGELKFENPADRVAFEELADDFLISQFNINPSEVNKTWIFGDGQE